MISKACPKLYLNTGFALATTVIVIMFLFNSGRWRYTPITSTWQIVHLAYFYLFIYFFLQRFILVLRLCFRLNTLMCILALFSKLSVVCLVLSGPKGTSFFSCSRYSRSLARLQTHKHRPSQQTSTIAQRREPSCVVPPKGRGHPVHTRVMFFGYGGKTRSEVLRLVTEYLFLCRFGFQT